jgi:hypothetical protein
VEDIRDTAQSDWATGRNPEADPIIRSLTEDDAEALSLNISPETREAKRLI